MKTRRTLARRPSPVDRNWRRAEAAGCATSCEGYDHGNHRDSQHYAHHHTHARRRGFRLQGTPDTIGKKVIDLGPPQATVDIKQTIPLTPLVGGLALAGGIGLLIMGVRRA